MANPDTTATRLEAKPEGFGAVLSTALGSGVVRRALFLSFFISVLGLVTPIFVLQVYDRVIFHAGLSTLYGLLVGVVLAAVFDYVLKQYRARIYQSLGVRLDVVTTEALFKRLLHLPLAELERQPAAHWQSLFRDLELVRVRFAGPIALLLVDLPFVLLSVALILVIAAPLGWVIAVIVLAFLLLAWASSRKAKVRAGEEKQAQLSRDGQVTEFASARQVVKAQVLDEAVTTRWREAQHQSIEATLQRSVSTDRYRDLGQMLAQGATILMVTVGALAILNQEMTMGALIAANMLSGRVTGPLNMLVGQWRTLVAYRQARARLDALFQSPIEKSGGSVPLAESKGELEIQHLQFRYPGAVNDVLVALNGRVGPGGLHGLVGPNGSGKTTLLKILAALYEPSEGRVLLDGADVAQFARRDLAQWIGYLPQAVQPFAGTIRENITMAWPQATDDDVRRAAGRAYALEFIHDLPDGFDSQMGEFGLKLSAGQRQRIALAGVLVRDPPILLLDEPTSDLDREAEAGLRDELHALSRHGHTILIVTHSAVLLSVCDGIIALRKDGRLRAAGSAGEVLPELGLVRADGDTE